MIVSSHGFTADSDAPSGSASKASSNCLISQMVREFIRLGGGIRPSLTMLSNVVGEIPT
jgi:hypothetical protein